MYRDENTQGCQRRIIFIKSFIIKSIIEMYHLLTHTHTVESLITETFHLLYDTFCPFKSLI